MRSLLTTLSVMFFVLAIAMTPVAYAFSTFLADAVAKYPVIAGTDLDNCALCHVSAANLALNPYGTDFKANTFNFDAIEGMDSDGDGFTNLVEIMALTFPGDASDFPSGGGGGGRIASRAKVADVVDASDIAVAADTDRKEGLAAWMDLNGDVADTRADAAQVRSQVLKSNGSPTGKVADIELINGDTGLAADYGNKRFMVAWNNDDGGVDGQPLKSKTGKKVKKPLQLTDASTNPALAWDAAAKLFTLATDSEDAVEVNRVDTKGKVKSFTRASLLTDIDHVFGFAAGASTDGQVLLGGEPSGTQQRPVGVLLVDGDMSSMSAGYYGFSSKTQDVAAAFGAAELGVVAWSLGGKLQVASLNSDGSLNGKAKKVKKSKAEKVGVAAQADGTFLVVWTDPKTKKLMAIDVEANGKVTGKAFELQDSGEVVDADALGVATVGSQVLVVYATSGSSAALRSVVVATK